MEHQNLWAPWRLTYITGGEQKSAPPAELPWLPEADRGCFMCRAAVDPDLRETLTAVTTETALVVLNRYPYNNGHLLIAPRRHVGELGELTAEESRACQDLLVRMTDVLRTKVNAEGFNIGLNLGKLAGAGLPGHLHWHIVPRWNGDTNFMPVMAGIRVMPQALEAMWELLQETL